MNAALKIMSSFWYLALNLNEWTTLIPSEKKLFDSYKCLPHWILESFFFIEKKCYKLKRCHHLIAENRRNWLSTTMFRDSVRVKFWRKISCQFFAKENSLSLGWLVGIHWTVASIPHPWSYNRSQVLKDNCNKILMGSCDLRSTHEALKATKTESRGMISVACWTFWLLLNIRLSRINVIV